MTRFLLLACAAALFLAQPALAKKSDDFFKTVACRVPQSQILGPDKGYGLPVPKYSGGPNYPLNMIEKLGEGFAEIAYTIDADGRTSNVTLVSAAGATAMIDRSVNWVKELTYDPATFRGKPIALHGNEHLFAFVVDTSKPRVTANRWVDANYQKGVALIQGGQVDEAITLLADTLTRGEARQRMTLYEQSMISLALAWAQFQQDRPAVALQYARRATINGGRFLAPSAKGPAWRMRTVLELRDGHLGFLNCSSLVSDGAPSDLKFVTDEAYNALTSQVRMALDSKAPLTVQATLRDNPLREGAAEWVHPLVRRKFAFDNPAPGVRDFTLTCQTQILTDVVNTTQEWAVPDSAGYCTIRVTGEAGATFQFVEAW